MERFAIVLFILLVAGCGTEEVPDGSSGSLKVSDDVEYGETDYQKIVAPSNELGWKLLPMIKPSEEGNRFFSAPSLYMALSMVYNGAEGETKKQMAKVLEVPGMETEGLNRSNASLMAQLHSESETIQFNIANSIWLNKDYQFQKAFEKDTRDYFNAEIEEIDVADPGSVKRINDWVKQSTNGKIDKMAPDPLPVNMVSMLLNAIYFKGDWQYPFEEDDTKEEDFHLADGSVKKVPLMALNKTLPYLETEDFQAVSLPYGEGEMNMKVFLPKKETTWAQFEEKLTSANWDNWTGAFQQSYGTLRLPKFELEYEVGLNEPLKQLGMVKAFKEDAEFPLMVEGEGALYIYEVKQKTYLNVNEKRTEAAAVTGIMEGSSGPPAEPFNMQVDRPFFITIEDTETGLILFLGAIAEPMSIQ